MSKYIVIRRSSIGELELAVNAYVAQKGYEPKGGIIGVHTNSEWTETIWCQAIWQPDSASSGD